MVVGSTMGSLAVRLAPDGPSQKILFLASSITWGVVFGNILFRFVYIEEFESSSQPKKAVHPFISFSQGALLGASCQLAINKLKN